MFCNICKAKAEQLKHRWSPEIDSNSIAEILHRYKWCHSCVLTSIEEEVRNVKFGFIKQKNES